jgi:hypothetical protein
MEASAEAAFRPDSSVCFVIASLNLDAPCGAMRAKAVDEAVYRKQVKKAKQRE